MARSTVLSPGVIKLATPGSFTIETAAASARSFTNGIQTCPYGSVKLRFQVASPEIRLNCPGTPRSRQLELLIDAGSAFPSLQVLFRNASDEIGLKSALTRLRLVKLV